VKFQGWEVPVGRVSVYLLDTDLPENDQKFRDLTAHVYGGDQWNRISQEIVLGIGGVRFLRALGVRPSVYHMNEGHSAFLTLELLRDHASAAETHAEAMERVRSECVFTTHTPVPAGHDRFDAGLVGPPSALCSVARHDDGRDHEARTPATRTSRPSRLP